MVQVVEILPRERQGFAFFHIDNIMATDDLATQGARASAAMILTQLNHDSTVPARCGLICRMLIQISMC